MKFLCITILLMMSGAAASFQIQQEVLDNIEARHGPPAKVRLQRWEELSQTGLSLAPKQQLERVNRFFNRLPFVSDIVHWGTEDYWATPVEALATFGADCEDYSIAKYLTLRALGIDEEKLRITYVKALELNQAHMVVAYYPTPDADPLILDNLINKIKPASQRTDLMPVYSFNGEGLWLTKLQRQDEQRLGSPDRLDNWVKLNRRILDTLR